MFVIGVVVYDGFNVFTRGGTSVDLAAGEVQKRTVKTVEYKSKITKVNGTGS